MFAKQLELARLRILELQQRAREDPPRRADLLEQALEELARTSEILRAADEKLAEQSGELLAARQALEALERRLGRRSTQLEATNRIHEDALLLEKAARASAERAEQRFRDLVQSLDGVVWEMDLATLQFTFMSQRAEAVLGYPIEHWFKAPASWLNCIHPEDRERVMALYMSTLERGQGFTVEHRAIRPDGDVIWLRESVHVVHGADGTPCQLRGLMVDITERKRADEAIHFQAGLLDSVEQAVIAVDLQGIITYWNRFAEVLYGWTAAEAVGKHISTIAPVDGTRAQAVEIMRHVRDGTSWSGEFAVQHRDGTIFQVLVTDSPVYDAEGNVIGIVGVSQDITERRKADEALRASEQRFRAIFDNVGVGIALDSLEGKPVESNPALQRMLGYTRDELARLHFTDLTHKEDVAVEEALFDELVAGARDSYFLEKRYLPKDGGAMWASVQITLVRDATGTPEFAVAMVEDITDRKRVAADLALAQRRLVEIQEAERLHLARELHDSTVQLLLGISYQLVEIRRKLAASLPADAASGDAIAGALEGIRRQLLGTVSQVRGLIGGLRPAGLEEFGLAAAIEGYVARLQREGKPPIPVFELELAHTGTVLPKRVALSLFRAAQEALRNALQHAQARRIHLALRLPHGHAILTVRDDGRGFKVPERLSELARDDHFGLVGIAERVAIAGGNVNIRSRPGAGTEVSITIPMREVERDNG